MAVTAGTMPNFKIPAPAGATPIPFPATPEAREKEARVVREFNISGQFAAMLELSNIHPISVKTALEGYLRDAGDPKDPIERMLIEQMVIAHHRLAALHVSAQNATNVEFTKVLNAAAVRLMGEIRRSALTIRQYRLPPGQKQVNLIKEQHIQVNQGSKEESFSARREVNSDPLSRRMHGNDRPPESRSAELAETPSVVG